MAGSGCLAKYRCIAFLPRLGSVAPAGFAQTTLKPLFEEVPSAASGLTWRHENGPLAGLLLAGDNRRRLRLSGLRQRRLDGHLPGERREVRFSHPGSSLAQCALPQQSRRDIYGRGRKGRRHCRRLWHGRRCRGLRWRRLARSVCHAVWPQHSLSQQWQRDVHRRDGKGRLGGSRLGFQCRLV